MQIPDFPGHWKGLTRMELPLTPAATLIFHIGWSQRPAALSPAAFAGPVSGPSASNAPPTSSTFRRRTLLIFSGPTIPHARGPMATGHTTLASTGISDTLRIRPGGIGLGWIDAPHHQLMILHPTGDHFSHNECSTRAWRNAWCYFSGITYRAQGGIAATQCRPS